MSTLKGSFLNDEFDTFLWQKKIKYTAIFWQKIAIIFYPLKHGPNKTKPWPSFQL
jgi:hypothetical protein